MIWGASPPLGRWDSQLVIGELVEIHGPSFCLLRVRNRCAFCDVEDNAPYANSDGVSDEGFAVTVDQDL